MISSCIEQRGGLLKNFNDVHPYWSKRQAVQDSAETENFEGKGLDENIVHFPYKVI